MLPRHAAGSFKLKEGTGPITGMQSCGEFLEMYKVDKTFRVKSPESIDPEETNPNAMWVTSPTDDVGTGNPIVARAFLQNCEMLNSAIFEQEIDKDKVIMTLHSCKEALITCDKICCKVRCRVPSARRLSWTGRRSESWRRNSGARKKPCPRQPPYWFSQKKPRRSGGTQRTIDRAGRSPDCH